MVLITVVVQGAGTPEVNGIYIRTNLRHHNGDVYRKGDTGFALMKKSPQQWCLIDLGPVFRVASLKRRFFYACDSDAEKAPFLGWFIDGAAEPAPFLTQGPAKLPQSVPKIPPLPPMQSTDDAEMNIAYFRVFHLNLVGAESPPDGQLGEWGFQWDVQPYRQLGHRVLADITDLSPVARWNCWQRQRGRSELALRRGDMLLKVHHSPALSNASFTWDEPTLPLVFGRREVRPAPPPPPYVCVTDNMLHISWREPERTPPTIAYAVCVQDTQTGNWCVDNQAVRKGDAYHAFMGETLVLFQQLPPGRTYAACLAIKTALGWSTYSCLSVPVFLPKFLKLKIAGPQFEPRWETIPPDFSSDRKKKPRAQMHSSRSVASTADTTPADDASDYSDGDSIRPTFTHFTTQGEQYFLPEKILPSRTSPIALLPPTKRITEFQVSTDGNNLGCTLADVKGNIVVTEVSHSGQIPQWNASASMGKKVDVNDMLVRVNGLDTATAMMSEMQCNQPLMLTFSRVVDGVPTSEIERGAYHTDPDADREHLLRRHAEISYFHEYISMEESENVCAFLSNARDSLDRAGALPTDTSLRFAMQKDQRIASLVTDKCRPKSDVVLLSALRDPAKDVDALGRAIGDVPEDSHEAFQARVIQREWASKEACAAVNDDLFRALDDCNARIHRKYGKLRNLSHLERALQAAKANNGDAGLIAEGDRLASAWRHENAIGQAEKRLQAATRSADKNTKELEDALVEAKTMLVEEDRIAEALMLLREWTFEHKCKDLKQQLDDASKALYATLQSNANEGLEEQTSVRRLLAEARKLELAEREMFVAEDLLRKWEQQKTNLRAEMSLLHVIKRTSGGFKTEDPDAGKDAKSAIEEARQAGALTHVGNADAAFRNWVKSQRAFAEEWPEKIADARTLLRLRRGKGDVVDKLKVAMREGNENNLEQLIYQANSLGLYAKNEHFDGDENDENDDAQAICAMAVKTWVVIRSIRELQGALQSYKLLSINQEIRNSESLFGEDTKKLGEPRWSHVLSKLLEEAHAVKNRLEAHEALDSAVRHRPVDVALINSTIKMVYEAKGDLMEIEHAKGVIEKFESAQETLVKMLKSPDTSRSAADHEGSNFLSKLVESVETYIAAGAGVGEDQHIKDAEKVLTSDSEGVKMLRNFHAQSRVDTAARNTCGHVEERFMQLIAAVNETKQCSVDLREADAAKNRLAAERGLLMACEAVLDNLKNSEANLAQLKELLLNARFTAEQFHADVGNFESVRVKLDEEISSRQTAKEAVDATLAGKLDRKVLIQVLGRARTTRLSDSVIQCIRRKLKEVERTDLHAELRRAVRENDFCVAHMTVKKANEVCGYSEDVAAGEQMLQHLTKLCVKGILKASHGKFGTPEWLWNPRWLLVMKKPSKVWVVAQKDDGIDTLEMQTVKNKCDFEKALLPAPRVLASGIDMMDAYIEDSAFLTISSLMHETGSVSLSVMSEVQMSILEVPSFFPFHEIVSGEWPTKTWGLPRIGREPPPLSWYRNPQYFMQFNPDATPTVVACVLGSTVPTCVHFVRNTNAKRSSMKHVDADARNHEVLCFSEYAQDALTILDAAACPMFLVPSVKDKIKKERQAFQLLVLSTAAFQIEKVNN